MRMSLLGKCAALLVVPLLCMATPKVWIFAQTESKAATERELSERERAITQATTAILDAFRSYSIVALSEGTHGNEQGHGFRLALVRDPRFARVVNDIVVEF